MTKTECVKRLEDKVRDLEATIAEQTIRIAALEARPIQSQWCMPYYSRWYYQPACPNYPIITCEGEAIPLPADNIDGADSAVIGAGYAPWSYTTESVDILPGTADVHVL